MQKKQLPLPEKGEEIQPEKPGSTLADFISGLPAGTKLSDIFLDTADLTAQLKYSKRTINNMRKAGKISHTCLEEKGKVFYFFQEVVAMLINNAVIGKDSPLKKQGFIKSVTTFTGLFSLLSFDVDALAAFVCLG
jgi:hypothetical protein